MDRFARALAFVFDVEGGFSDDRRDPGGMTNFGITAATLARARKRDPSLPWTVASINKDHATAIYRADYWSAFGAEFCPPGLDLIYFDACVQHAPPSPQRWLQLAIGVPGDGVIGPVTRERLTALTPTGTRRAIIEFAAQRMRHYMMLDDDSRVDFGLGWSRRLCGCLAEALAWTG